MRCANEGVARPLGVGIDSMVSENQQTSAEIEELNESWRTVIFAHSSRSISFNPAPKLCMQFSGCDAGLTSALVMAILRVSSMSAWSAKKRTC